MDSVSYLFFLFLFTANPDQLCVCVDAVDVIVLGGCCLGRGPRPKPKRPEVPELRQTLPKLRRGGQSFARRCLRQPLRELRQNAARAVPDSARQRVIFKMLRDGGRDWPAANDLKRILMFWQKGLACISVDRAPSLSSLALVLAFAYCSTLFVCDLHASLQDRRFWVGVLNPNRTPPLG